MTSADVFSPNIEFARKYYLCTKISNYAYKQECTHTLQAPGQTTL